MADVISPLPGVFYRKPAPDAPFFVEVGDAVQADTVIGLVEVMKQFSELTAGQAGKVSAILLEDGDALEPGQVVAVIDEV